MDLLDILDLLRWSRAVRTATAIAFFVCCFAFRDQLIAVIVNHGQERAQEMVDVLLRHLGASSTAGT